MKTQSTVDISGLSVPGVAYHQTAMIITAHEPPEGWTITNPVNRLPADEVVIGNFARLQQQSAAKLGL